MIDTAAIIKYLLKNWKTVLFVVMVLMVVGKFRYDYKKLEEAYETSVASLEQQIDGLRSIHEEELARRQRAIDEYKQKLEDLEQQYDNILDDIEKDREIKRADYTRQFKDDQAALAEEINKIYGFNHAP